MKNKGKLRMSYMILVKLLLDYCIQFKDQHFKKDVSKLERVHLILQGRMGNGFPM